MNNGFYGFPNILGVLRGTNLKVLGKAGATAGAGLAGGTISGAPTSGQFDLGEGVFGQDGSLWICTVAGSPGTFTKAGAHPLSTKGDLFGYDTAANRVPVGSNDQVLIADSAQSLGLRWGAAPAGAGGALTQIAQSVLSSTTASVTFSSITGAYSALLLSYVARTTSANNFGDNLQLQFNADTAANYDYQLLHGNNATATAVAGNAQTSIPVGHCAGGGTGAGQVAGGSIDIPFYAAATLRKVTVSRVFSFEGTAAGSNLTLAWTGGWRSTAAVTQIVLTPGAGSFAAGTSFTLYGLS